MVTHYAQMVFCIGFADTFHNSGRSVLFMFYE